MGAIRSAFSLMAVQGNVLQRGSPAALAHGYHIALAHGCFSALAHGCHAGLVGGLTSEANRTDPAGCRLNTQLNCAVWTGCLCSLRSEGTAKLVGPWHCALWGSGCAWAQGWPLPAAL